MRTLLAIVVAAGLVLTDLVERGMRDLDERSGFFGRLERRLLPRRETDRRR